MSLSEKFDKSAEDVKKLQSKPTDEELLELYALFKQATIGDCNTAKGCFSAESLDRPGMFDFKGKAKWDAWNAREGMDETEAKEAYVTKVNLLVEMYGLD